MTSILHACPYCGSSGAAFELLAGIPSQRSRVHWYLLGQCGVCKEVALVKLNDNDLESRRASPIDPTVFGRDKPLDQRFEVISFHPQTSIPSAPENVPDNIASAFVEAEASFNNGHLSAAGACYRKAIERAVKASFPDGKGMLNQRIRELEKQGKLPTTLIDLLDQVKLLGNLAVHEMEEDPTEEDCEAASEFSWLFLTYMFSLPAKIEKVRRRLVKP